MSPKPPKRDVVDPEAKLTARFRAADPSSPIETEIQAAINSPALGKKKPSNPSKTNANANANAANSAAAATQSPEQPPSQSQHHRPDKHRHKHAKSSKSKNSSPASTTSDLTTWTHLSVDRSGATLRTVCTHDGEDGEACTHSGKERRYAGIPRVDEPAVKITMEGVKAMEESDERT